MASSWDTQGLQPPASRTVLSSPLDFTLGLDLAKSTSSPREKRWPITALEHPEVNKPQARMSGDFHSSPIHSNTCIEVTSGTLALTFWTLAR
jgi:hypothetical protein